MSAQTICKPYLLLALSKQKGASSSMMLLLQPRGCLSLERGRKSCHFAAFALPPSCQGWWLGDEDHEAAVMCCTCPVYLSACLSAGCSAGRAATQPACPDACRSILDVQPRSLDAAGAHVLVNLSELLMRGGVTCRHTDLFCMPAGVHIQCMTYDPV